MSGPMVELQGLSRSFGKTVAVADVSFTVPEGSAVGFIGPNGAGKSTTLKMLATILRPSRGDAVIDGRSLTRDRALIRRLIGYMPDVCGLYEEMMVHEYLRFFAAVYGIRGNDAEKAVTESLDLTGLDTKADALCGNLSRGMSQRLHLARVLLHDPKVLLLDEPAAGLDPRARVEFKELVVALRRLGKTLLISSHILSELAAMCDEVAIIEKGALVYSGPIRGVGVGANGGADEGRVFQVRALAEPEAGRSFGDLSETVRSFEYVDAVREGDERETLLVRFRAGYADVHRLCAELIGRGYKVERFAEEQVGLEEAFIRMTKGLVS